MKTRLLLAFVGLAIGFVLPTFAQQTTLPDPQLREALATLNKKYDDGFVNSDAAALAALYTDDGVHVTFNGPPIYGREAIQKHFEDDFKQLHFNKYLSTLDPNKRVSNATRRTPFRPGQIPRKRRKSGWFRRSKAQS